MRPFLFLAILALAGCSKTTGEYRPGNLSDSGPAKLIGSILPPFSLSTPSGDSTVTSADLVGHPTMIVLWATWCPSCLQEVGTLRVLHDTYDTAGLKIISLSVDESPAPVPLMVQKLGMKWPVLVGASPWFSALGLESLPQIFLLDRTGKVVDALTGVIEEPVFHVLIPPLLAGP